MNGEYCRATSPHWNVVVGAVKKIDPVFANVLWKSDGPPVFGETVHRRLNEVKILQLLRVRVDGLRVIRQVREDLDFLCREEGS